MKFTTTVVAVAVAFGQIGLAAPSPQETIQLQVIDSGCKPFAAPSCCIPVMCQCKDGRYYLFNNDDARTGGGGCNPPWGYLAESLSGIAGYCC